LTKAPQITPLFIIRIIILTAEHNNALIIKADMRNSTDIISMTHVCFHHLKYKLLIMIKVVGIVEVVRLATFLFKWCQQWWRWWKI